MRRYRLRMPRKRLRPSMLTLPNLGALLRTFALGLASPVGRQANSTIPVVYISGDSAIHWGAEGVPNSVMVTKPFFLPQIITALSTLLNDQPTINPDDPT